MPSMTVQDIKDELQNISAVISNLERRGKATSVMKDRYKRFLVLLKKTQNKKQIGRYVKDLEYIQLTENIIIDLKTKGKSTVVLEARLKELHKELALRKRRHLLQKRKWADKHKDSIKEYYKQWAKSKRMALTDYMRSYCQKKREQQQYSTPSSPEK